MSRTLLRNIGQLVVVPAGPVRGSDMQSLRTIDAAAMILADDRIEWFGAEREMPRITVQKTIDANGGAVIPGLIDCHTHAVFAGSREREFVQKIEGRAYLEILESGGGIHSSVKSVRAASEDELFNASRPRLERMLRLGVTTAEVKSGYGLSVADELKMLRVAKRIAASLPMEIVGTYLAAHTIPKEFSGRADDYIDSVTTEAAFTQIRDEGLAEFADVFCERGAFDVSTAERYLKRCAAAGLRAKVHADQLSLIGAGTMGARLGAVSVDHLEYSDDATIEAIRAAGTIPVVLPGCSFFLRSATADARKFIAADLPVAVATDVNPGSCMVESLPLVMTMACTMLRMTPAETLIAATANAAAALSRSNRLGAIAIGHQADLLVLDVPNYERMMYDVGRNCVAMVIKSGCVV